ncbi:MAG: NUDIX domain-containing protein [Nitrososphaerota archaeon]|nr:NUDIX domain-containing protein [Nitrososphaerota archaeon]
MPGYQGIVLGAGTVVHRRGKMLVVKRARDPNVGMWAFPGGRVEVGESPMDAALRETREEVGLVVESEGLFDVVTYFGRGRKKLPGLPHGSQVVVVDYLAKPTRGRVVLNEESSDYRWVTPSELETLYTTPQMRACARKFAEMKIY